MAQQPAKEPKAVVRGGKMRSPLHLKYQRMFGLNEQQMRWCEWLAAISLRPLTLVITNYSVVSKCRGETK